MNPVDADINSISYVLLAVQGNSLTILPITLIATPYANARKYKPAFSGGFGNLKDSLFSIVIVWNDILAQFQNRMASIATVIDPATTSSIKSPLITFFLAARGYSDLIGRKFDSKKCNNSTTCNAKGTK